MIAEWLNTVFAPFDRAVFTAVHAFAEATGGALTVPMRLVSALAYKGLGMILLGLLLLFLFRTRRTGLAACCAMFLGILCTNIILKDLIARPRPYAALGSLYREWWLAMGASVESDASFPSGHATVTAAAMTSIFLTNKKRWSFLALLFALLMGFSRVYLMVHYPSDVLGGFLIGAAAALIAWPLTGWIWRWCQTHRDLRPIRFFLTFDPLKPLKSRLRRGGKDA